MSVWENARLFDERRLYFWGMPNRWCDTHSPKLFHACLVSARCILIAHCDCTLQKAIFIREITGCHMKDCIHGQPALLTTIATTSTWKYFSIFVNLGNSSISCICNKMIRSSIFHKISFYVTSKITETVQPTRASFMMMLWWRPKLRDVVTRSKRLRDSKYWRNVSVNRNFFISRYIYWLNENLEFTHFLLQFMGQSTPSSTSRSETGVLFVGGNIERTSTTWIIEKEYYDFIQITLGCVDYQAWAEILFPYPELTKLKERMTRNPKCLGWGSKMTSTHFNKSRLLFIESCTPLMTPEN